MLGRKLGDVIVTTFVLTYMFMGAGLITGSQVILGMSVGLCSASGVSILSFIHLKRLR